MTKYAEILTNRKIISGQDTLTYAIPDELSAELKPGQIVQIPLRNRPTKGIVLSSHEHTPTFKTLPIKEIAEEIGLSNWQLELMNWISSHYMCPLFKTLQSFIPKKILSNTKRRKKKQDESPGPHSPFPPKNLTECQKQAIDQILNSKPDTSLIHGITGSGKTEIYLQIARHFAEQNKQTLILVPEISLTPQTVKYFQNTFPDQLSVIHSKVSEGEKIQAWEDIFNQKSKVVIGSRSSIFAPFQNLGAIIIDEEHDNSYKQDQSPRYHTRDVALKIQELTDCKVILGSATPSIESYYHAKSGKYQLIELKKRANSSPLPIIKLIDLRKEAQKRNFSPFSDELRDKIEIALQQNEQVLLFLNRRGSSSNITCKDCGQTVSCKKCDTAFTYHQSPSFQDSPTLLCHHCGIIKTPPSSCPDCQGQNLMFYGIGTQKVESELLKLFPSARVLRADKDTTSTKHGFAEIYKKFRNHEADILIGTQMISKGLNLPKVNLVGVMLADIGAHMPDFRAQERTFQLLTQVAGRAGRHSGQGEVLLQTFNPENAIMQLAQQQHYIPFFDYELPIRKNFPYPPFSELIKLTYENTDPKQALLTSQKLKKKLDLLNKKFEPQKQFKISLYPAMLHKKNNKFRWCILINGHTPSEFLNQPELEADTKDWIIDVHPAYIG